MQFARPFRYGSVTIEAAPQAFVLVVDVEGKGRAVGASAEMLRRNRSTSGRGLSPSETIEQLRCSLLIARELYLSQKISIPPSVCTPPASRGRSSIAPRKISRRLPRPSARPEIDKAILECAVARCRR